MQMLPLLFITGTREALGHIGIGLQYSYVYILILFIYHVKWFYIYVYVYESINIIMFTNLLIHLIATACFI